MRICRFDDNRLGVIDGDRLRDVSQALEVLPALRWPVPHGDQLIANLPEVMKQIHRLLAGAPVLALDGARLLSPVANPSKIIAAPLNYTAHVDEVGRTPAIHAGTHSFEHDGFPSPIDKLGLFLKAGTSIVGAGEAIILAYPERRTDHEVELVAIIGREGRNIPEAAAMDYICGYCVGLDMTVRGPEDRSFRKSPDTYTVLGPSLVTADEVEHPDRLDLRLSIGGAVRQRSNTQLLTVGISRLIAIASSCCTLYPGDVIMTGTPDGVGEVSPGDEILASVEGLGELRSIVRAGGARAIHGKSVQSAR